MKKLNILLTSALLIVVVVASIILTRENNTEWALLRENADWQPQDYVDSQGIKTVHLEAGKLILDAHLVGGSDNYCKGEIFLDLSFFLGLECQVPIDLSKSKITVEVEVPDAFVGWASNPNGVQVFVKDREWRSQYGGWVNIVSGGRHEATLSPTTGQTSGYTETGFDPKRIRIIGVKFAIGTGSSASYDGPLYVTGINVEPPFTLSPQPSLNQSTPQPLFSLGDKIEVKNDGFYLNNNKWFVVGGNWRIIEYGQNLGTTAWFPSGNGISKHTNFVKISLDYFRRAGIKLVRVDLLTDGRTMFDKDGHVTGYNEIFREDVRTFLDLANEAGIKVEFVIFDFLIAGKAENVDGVWIRGRSKIITETQLKNEFINEFLTPFLKEFGGHPALMCFDVINEPEWIVSRQDGGDWESVNDPSKAVTSVSGERMKTFISDCINAIRGNAPGKLVSVGVSFEFLPLVENLSVDYYALHYYPWMGELENLTIPTGKTWVLEEYPTNATALSISDYLDFVLDKGGAGASLWNLSPGIDRFTFSCSEKNATLSQLRSWVDDHEPQIIPEFPSAIIMPLFAAFAIVIIISSKRRSLGKLKS